MSRVDAIESTVYPEDSELISDDGVPLETPWHRAEIGLLVESISNHWRDRDDYYVGGNMFIYFSAEQARNRDYRGPDFYLVLGVPRRPARPYWAIWKEQFHYPDLIVELTSPSTADEDRTTKKAIYERIFQTPEYFIHDPDTDETLAWRLDDEGQYQPIAPDEQGRFWCETVGMFLGPWVGSYAEIPERVVWLRFFTPEGNIVPLPAEEAQQQVRFERERANIERQKAETERVKAEAERQIAETERQRAEAERVRADDAVAEIARLRAMLDERQQPGG